MLLKCENTNQTNNLRSSISGGRVSKDVESTVSWACWPTRLLCNLRIVLCFWAQQNLSDAWGRNSLTIWDAAATAQSTRQLCHNPRASSSCRGEYEREQESAGLDVCFVPNITHQAQEGSQPPQKLNANTT